MNNQDSIEKFLYYNAPTGGFPDESFTVGVKFEAGGAYEDWGWVVYKAGKIYCEHKNLQSCLKIARDKYKNELREITTGRNKNHS